MINDSIWSFVQINLDKNKTEQMRDSHTREIRWMILTPTCPQPNTAPDLVDDNKVLELAHFHRSGFRLGEQEVLDNDYIAANGASFYDFVHLFWCCMQHPTDLETPWNASHSQDNQIWLKKWMPLAFFHIGSRKSIQIDRKRLYFILSHYKKVCADFPDGSPDFSSGYNRLDNCLLQKLDGVHVQDGHHPRWNWHLHRWCLCVSSFHRSKGLCRQQPRWNHQLAQHWTAYTHSCWHRWVVQEWCCQRWHVGGHSRWRCILFYCDKSQCLLY